MVCGTREGLQSHNYFDNCLSQLKCNINMSIECVVESLDELYARVYATVDNTSSHLTPNHGCQPCLSLLSVKLFCAWSYAALMIVLLQMSR